MLSRLLLIAAALPLAATVQSDCLEEELPASLGHLEHARQAQLSAPDPQRCPKFYVGNLCAALNSSLTGRREMSSLLRKGVLMVCPISTVCGPSGTRMEGNRFGEYAAARDVAIAGNMDFMMVRPPCPSLTKTHSLLELSPAVVARERPNKPASLWAARDATCSHAACSAEDHGGDCQHQVVRKAAAPRSPREQTLLHPPSVNRLARGQASAYQAAAMRTELRKGLHRWANCIGRAKNASASRASPERRQQLATLHLDDIAVHFRCGDAMGSPGMGLRRFDSLLKVIPDGRSVSVGIVTQPLTEACRAFQNGQRAGIYVDGVRGSAPGAYHNIGPGGIGQRCACACVGILEVILEYLRTRRPSARVTIRDQDERMGSYARIALAPLGSMCLGPSTFCKWPAIANAALGEYPFKGGVDDPPYMPYLTLARPPDPNNCFGATKASARIWAQALTTDHKDLSTSVSDTPR